MALSSEWIDPSIALGDCLCRASGDTIALAVGEAAEDGSCVLRGVWLNDPGPERRPPAASLVAALTRAAQLMGSPPSPSSAGAVSGLGVGRRFAAVSGWPETWGRLFASILLSQADHPSVLHHLGFRHPSREAFDRELGAKRARGEAPRESEAADHLRGYTQVRDALGRVEYYLEDQFYPEGPQDGGRHWDLVTADPVGFLRAVGRSLGVEPQLFPKLPNSPLGAIWLADEAGNKLGVMARPVWWEVPP